MRKRKENLDQFFILDTRGRMENRLQTKTFKVKSFF
jgi:hypothetical protein